MSKAIKLNDDVYEGLRKIQAPRETYSEVVARLLDLWRTLNGLEPILRGSIAYQEFKDRQAAKAAAAH